MKKIRDFVKFHKISLRDLAPYADMQYSVLCRYLSNSYKDKSGKMKGQILLALDKYISDQRIKLAIMRSQFSEIYNAEYPPEQ